MQRLCIQQHKKNKKVKQGEGIIMKSIVQTVFRIVADALNRAASAIGITFNEINIIVYYLVIPLTWSIMLDICLGTPIATFALFFIWVGIKIGTWGRCREWRIRLGTRRLLERKSFKEFLHFSLVIRRNGMYD